MNVKKIFDFQTALALNYKSLGLTDDEYVLLSITYSLVNNGVKFVNPSDLTLLCGFSSTKIDVIMTGLISKKYISNEFDSNGNIITSFNGIENVLLKEIKKELETEEKKNEETKNSDVNIAKYMEEFFNRPLSPLEYDVIQSWKNKNYSFDLIKGACDISAQNGNKSIRYIDTIIFEESRKMTLGTEEYQRRQQETIELSNVDWLNK